jgi:predicted membrane channel-forming protein YqfA (hemolysin III family)
MNRRNRALLGGFVMIAFVILYALIAMALAQSRPVQEAPGWLQPILYAALGLIWVLPMLPLVSWIARGRKI